MWRVGNHKIRLKKALQQDIAGWFVCFLGRPKTSGLVGRALGAGTAGYSVNKVMFTQIDFTMAEGDGYQEVLRWLETAVLENSEVRQWQEDNMQTAQQIAQREKALYRSRFLYDSVYG